MKDRVYNFSAGPAVLPEEVLEEAAREMLNHKHHGMSVMEMSHRSAMYQEIIDKTEADLRRLMGIPEEYSVLFLQGGASLQFAMIPMNILSSGGTADFINTGAWSKKAIKEAEILGKAHVAASSEDQTFAYIPREITLEPKSEYLHIVTNNTIYGTRFETLPDPQGRPLVADMSSNILSEPINVKDFSLIFAGAQKNLGPAGVTLVVLKKDLIGRHREGTPTMMRYETHHKAGSLFNTPPTYAIYMVGKVLEWIEALGGMEAMGQRNRKKAALLYDYLDESTFFRAAVADPRDRSLMNVPFLSPDAEKDALFIQEAAKAGLVNIKGHRSVGGMRASLYNAMPREGVEALVTFMKDFERRN